MLIQPFLASGTQNARRKLNQISGIRFLQKFPFFDIDQLPQVKLGPIYVCLSSASKGRLFLPVASTQSILQLWKQGWVGGTNTVQLPTHTEPLLRLLTTVLDRVTENIFTNERLKTNSKRKNRREDYGGSPNRGGSMCFVRSLLPQSKWHSNRHWLECPACWYISYQSQCSIASEFIQTARNYMDIPNQA